MLTGKYYTGFLSVCQILCRTPCVPRVSRAKRGIWARFEAREQNLFSWCRSHFRSFGVVIGPVRVAAGARCPLSIHKIFRKSTKRERKGGAGNQVPCPSPMRSAPEICIRNPHRKSASEIRTGENARLAFFSRPVFLESLELFEEEALVDLAGVAGLAQVVLFEGACAAGGVSAPAGDCFQVGASRGQDVGLAYAA